MLDGCEWCHYRLAMMTTTRAADLLFPTTDSLTIRDRERAAKRASYDAIIARIDASLARVKAGEVTAEEGAAELARIEAEADRLGL